MISSRSIAAALLFVLAACGDSDSRRTGVVRDSAGITIIENRRPSAIDVTWWRIDEPAALEIGGIHAPETHMLYRVAGAARLSDGRIAVANDGTGDIRYYSEDGVHLATTGRIGSAPGEFLAISGIVRLPGDSLIVNDATARRASVLDAQGAFKRSFTSRGAAPYATISGRFGDGSLAGMVFDPLMNVPEEGLQRPEILFVRLSADGVVLDTVAIVRGAERIVSVTMSGGSVQSVRLAAPPFARTTTHAIHGDRLYIGTADAPEVTAYDTVGNPTHIIRTGAQLRPITAQRLYVYTELAVASVPPEQQEGVRERLRSSPVGEYMPAYGDIATDAAGNLWMANYDDPIGPTGEWNVFDAEGRTLARVHLPVGFRVYDIGDDYVLGTERDDLDTEYVRLYRLVKPSVQDSGGSGSQ